MPAARHLVRLRNIVADMSFSLAFGHDLRAYVLKNDLFLLSRMHWNERDLLLSTTGLYCLAGCTHDIVRLENRGRESESYLWFINSRYHTLADHTMFTQVTPQVTLRYASGL